MKIEISQTQQNNPVKDELAITDTTEDMKQTKKDLLQLQHKDQQQEGTPKTPTLDENKIPAPRSPPPAPRKRPRGVMKCVRKLEFFEHRTHNTIIPSEQVVQEFFTTSFDQLNSSRKVIKRSSSLAFDRIASNTVSIATPII